MVPRFHEVTLVKQDRPRFSIFGWFLEPGDIYEYKGAEKQPAIEGGAKTKPAIEGGAKPKQAIERGAESKPKTRNAPTTKGTTGKRKTAAPIKIKVKKRKRENKRTS
jgi:hypothetical protein